MDVNQPREQLYAHASGIQEFTHYAPQRVLLVLQTEDLPHVNLNELLQGGHVTVLVVHGLPQEGYSPPAGMKPCRNMMSQCIEIDENQE